jgi:hypothetical protein
LESKTDAGRTASRHRAAGYSDFLARISSWKNLTFPTFPAKNPTFGHRMGASTTVLPTILVLPALPCTAPSWRAREAGVLWRQTPLLTNEIRNWYSGGSMTTAPDSLEIQTWSIDRFVPYARNPRKNDAAVDRMCSSIREFGFKIPVLARSDGEVVDGHLRLKAAKKLRITEVPVILCDEWTEAQVKAFRLMVNRSVTWAAWDEELLALGLQEPNEAEFDLSLTGFDPKEIDDLLFEEAFSGATVSATRPADNSVTPGLGRSRKVTQGCSPKVTHQTGRETARAPRGDDFADGQGRPGVRVI